MIRAFTPDDVRELERLYELHFKDDDALPNFLNYLCAYVVEDEKGVLTFGGVHDIAECVAVTNKDRSAKDRAKALYEVLDTSVAVCKEFGYDQMYAFIRDQKYAKRLLRNGFRLSYGQALIYDF